MKKLIILWVFINSLYAAAQPPPLYVPTSSLTGWYSFSGNANDLSGSGNNGVIYGAQLTSDANGTPNSAYLFAPYDQIVTPIHPQSMVSGAPVPSSCALFTWFNANVIGTSLGPNSGDGLGHCLISSDSAGHGGNALGVVSGSLTACVGVHWFRLPFQFTPGTWYHVGLNFDANTQVAELFVNGTSIGTANVLPPFQNVAPCLYTMGYVSNWGTWNVPYSGKMDEAGIWKRALNKCEITQLYNKNLFSASVQPQTQSILTGNSVNFTTGTTFINTTYQWQQNSGSGFVNITNTSPFSGANSPTLTVSNVSMQYNHNIYRCILTSGSCTLASNSATLNTANADGINVLNPDPDESSSYLYPNPTRGVFDIHNSEKTEIKIFNTLGKLVYECQSTESQKRIDMSSQPEGIYFIQIQQGTSIKVLKVVIKN